MYAQVCKILYVVCGAASLKSITRHRSVENPSKITERCKPQNETIFRQNGEETHLCEEQALFCLRFRCLYTSLEIVLDTIFVYIRIFRCFCYRSSSSTAVCRHYQHGAGYQDPNLFRPSHTQRTRETIFN